MTDFEWLEAYNAGRASVEGDISDVIHALERCMLILDSLGQGPVYRDARAALMKYREARN